MSKRQRECSHVVPGALRTFVLFISTPETGAATTSSVHCSVFNVTREREFHMREKKNVLDVLIQLKNNWNENWNGNNGPLLFIENVCIQPLKQDLNGAFYFLLLQRWCEKYLCFSDILLGYHTESRWFESWYTEMIHPKANGYII